MAASDTCRSHPRKQRKDRSCRKETSREHTLNPRSQERTVNRLSNKSQPKWEALAFLRTKRVTDRYMLHMEAEFCTENVG